ncbi:MAG: hypothetical protein COS08_00755 [Euryarchaeota archaeon CG01_land_8_20_14_3_00_38_12]|nr:MAG: hypothetical protein COS08_00755 [Euryarchaeota archaeon CG01_land_8_20_14_3_00_38_12]PJB22261.1 MAG: hypothetical protein CO114_00970 [Euryarchaeota archaeon CG_4_9_14_3_um_filter_38_12]
MSSKNVEWELENLKDFAKKVLQPLKEVAFPVIVEATTGKKIIKIDLEKEEDKELIEGIKQVAHKVSEKYYENEELIGNRPNDVSEPLEQIFVDELINEGIEGKRLKRKGYPDLEIKDKKDRRTYIEIKVSRIENVEKGSPRNFYYKPSKKTKIKEDARHLLFGFVIKERIPKHWKILGWKLVDLAHLKVNFKPEFNADNKEIYKEEAIIAEEWMEKQGLEKFS